MSRLSTSLYRLPYCLTTTLDTITFTFPDLYFRNVNSVLNHSHQRIYVWKFIYSYSYVFEPTAAAFAATCVCHHKTFEGQCPFSPSHSRDNRGLESHAKQILLLTACSRRSILHLNTMPTTYRNTNLEYSQVLQRNHASEEVGWKDLQQVLVEMPSQCRRGRTR